MPGARAEFAAIICAAGAGTRMGAATRKQYYLIGGTPIVEVSVRAFVAARGIGAVCVLVPAADESDVAKLLSRIDFDGTLAVAAGGATRQGSVRIGLDLLDAIEPRPEYVLIHDAVRPWISGNLISRVLEGARVHGACVPVVPPVDALKRIDQDGRCTAHLVRGEAVCAQTPQGFRFAEILEAHRAAARDRDDFIDDAAVYAARWGSVFTVAGDPANRKITFPHDLPPSGSTI